MEFEIRADENGMVDLKDWGKVYLADMRASHAAHYGEEAIHDFEGGFRVRPVFKEETDDITQWIADGLGLPSECFKELP